MGNAFLWNNRKVVYINAKKEWAQARGGGGGGLPYETDGDARRLA